MQINYILKGRWPPDAKKQLTGKDPGAGKDWGQEEKGAKEDEMVGWPHWLNGHEFEQTQGDSEGQASLECCSQWGTKIWTPFTNWTTPTTIGVISWDFCLSIYIGELASNKRCISHCGHGHEAWKPPLGACDYVTEPNLVCLLSHSKANLLTSTCSEGKYTAFIVKMLIQGGRVAHSLKSPNPWRVSAKHF